MVNYYPWARRFAVAGLFLVGAVGGSWAQAPTLLGTNPPANAQTVSLTAPLECTFSQPLIPASALGLQLFSRQRGGNLTHVAPATVRGATLRANPGPFLAGETVSYSLTTAVGSTGGALARPWVGQFTTATRCTGTGAFAASSLVAVGRYSDGLALGDVDGDGDLDLLVCSFSAISSTVSVRLNDGHGGFSGTQLVPVGQAPKRVQLADVDNDGDLDLLTASQRSSSISLRLNDGHGNFTGSTELALPAYPTQVVPGDLDGDGDLDLLVATNGGGLVVLRNTGGGAYLPGGSNSGGSLPSDAVLGDIDGDGDLDALATNLGSATVSIRLNNGAGNLSGGLDMATGPEPQALRLGDVDNDGDLDLLVSSGSTSTVRVHLNDGRGSFQPGQVVPVGIGPYTLVLGDVNGDGQLDLLTGNIYGYVSVRLGNGQGHFDGTGTQVTDFVNTADLALGDVDGDGDVDLLTTNYSGTQVGVQLNSGTASPPLAAGASLTVQGPLTLCPGTAGQLTATSTRAPQRYEWNTGATTAELRITRPGTYQVAAYFGDCDAVRASYVVRAAGCDSVSHPLLPNVLTPNGDGLNDQLQLTSLGPGSWTLHVFNRWGREVYRTEAYHDEWGPEAAPGLYYYQLTQLATATTHRGWVEVIR